MNDITDGEQGAILAYRESNFARMEVTSTIPPQFAGAGTVIEHKGVQALLDIQAKLGAAGGLSAADRALLQQVVDSNTALKASVDALNSRLATP